MANGSFTGQDIADAAKTAVNVGSYAHKVGSLAGWGMPGVFSAAAGPVGWGVKGLADVYSASPTKPGFWGRLLDLQLRPLRRLGILSMPEADVAYGGYGTEEAEQEGVAGIDTGASGHAREVTGPVDVTGLTLGGSEFGMDGDGFGNVDPNTEIDTTPGPAAQHGGDESVSVDATEAETEEDYEDYDEDVFADGGYVQKYADGDFVKKKAPSLTDTTVTDLLLFNSDRYDVWLTGESSPKFSSGAVTFEGKGDLPNLSLFGSGAPEGEGYNRTYGGSLRAGPFDIYGTKGKFTEGDYKKGTETYGASGQMPFGKRGIMTLGISKEKVEEILQHFKGKGGKKRYDIGYTGRGDGSAYGVKAFREQGDNSPRVQGLEGFYERLNPLGLGGNFRAEGSYVDPEIGKNALNAMLRYGIKF